MKKGRGQSLVDFAVLALLAVSIIIFGLYQFGDDLANFFARNDVENKFNKSRTVRFEKPQDLVSNVAVKFEGITIEPPVEKIIAQDLAAGSYIQTSGSAGRMAQMAKIMEEYVNQLNNLITNNAQGTALKNSLNDFKTHINPYWTAYDSVNPKPLEDKLSLLKVSTSGTVDADFTTIQTNLTGYLPTIGGSNPVRRDIIQTFTNDLLNFDSSMDYFIDPYLYVEYLGEEKKNTKDQDRELIDAIEAAMGTLSADEKANIADLIKLMFGGGYSSASPSAYNGMQMCNTFGGALDTATDNCTIAGP